MWELGSDAERPEWREVDSPFEKALYGVVDTAEGPYAIGDGGTVIADRGDGWEVIFDDGPRTRDNQLRGLDVTDDGKRIWFAGSSGALGCYDVVGRRKYDYSNPDEMTSTWEGITVAGQAGSEKVLVANGSGEILPFSVDGFDQDWEPVRKPASKGSNVAALAASPDGIGYAVDTSGNAFRTTADDGWEDIGIVNAQVKFYDIFAGENGRVYVAAGDGRIYRYDDSYHDWTPIGVAEKSLRAFAIERGEQDRMVVIGDGGTIYERAGRERWEEIPSPVGSRLFDVALGETDVIVGNSGTILERPDEPRDAGSSADTDNYDGRGEYFDNDEQEPGESGGDDTSSEGDDSQETSSPSGGSSSPEDGSSSSSDGSASSGGSSSGEDNSSRSGSSASSGRSSVGNDSAGDGGSVDDDGSSDDDSSSPDGGSASGGSTSSDSGSVSSDTDQGSTGK